MACGLLLSLFLISCCSAQECQYAAPITVTRCQEPEPVLPPEAIIPECDCLNDTKVEAQTNYGPVEGERLMTSSGQSIRMFRGLPYAKPPVGELQFKKPETPEAWTETLIAKDWPPRCIQSRKVGTVPEHLPTDSLDCLYLNVFAREQHPTTPCGDPVMVFIHGGGYSMGSTLDYGVEGIAERLVTKGVVVVNIQYRLGMWGFMSTGDEAQPGNLGLWDQTMALQWVQDNIAGFGGNPQKVTIFGQSAGGASVTALNLSPHSNTLFHNMIAMSGTMKAPWAMQSEEVKKNTKLLFEHTACIGTTPGESLDCLRNKTIDEQRSTDLLLKLRPADRPLPLILPFTPVEDGDYFPEPIAILEHKAPHKPIIIGTTHMDGAYLAAPPTDQWNRFHANFTASQLESVIEQGMAAAIKDPVARNIVLTLAKHHYLHENEKYRDPYKVPKHELRNPLFKQFIQFLSDIAFFAPTFAEATSQAKNGPTWLYSFDYFNQAAFPPEHLFKGAHHVMDLSYLFEATQFQKFAFNREDETVAELYSTLFTNFAKFSNPTPMPVNGITWDTFSTAHSNFLSIKSRPQMKYGYNKKSISFWNELVPEIITSLKHEADQKMSY